MGLFLGLQNVIIALVLAYGIGGTVAIFMILTGKTKRGAQISFGPFLILGTYLTLFYGEQIFNFYFRLIGIY